MMTLAIRPWITGVPAMPLIGHRDAWSHCKRAIEDAVGSDAYTTWLGSLNFVEVRKWALKLSVPTLFLKRWIDAHYADPLLKACQTEWPAVSHVGILVRSSLIRETRTVPVLALPRPPKAKSPWLRFYPYKPEMLFPGHPDLGDKGDGVKLKIVHVQRVVAVYYNVSPRDLLSSNRTAAVVKPRQVAMYLSRILTLRSYPEIGRCFGGRDHSTVLHAVRKVEALIATDLALAEEIETIKKLLQD